MEEILIFSLFLFSFLFFSTVLCLVSGNKGPQFYQVPPSVVAFATTQGGRLTCSAIGDPTPVVRWVMAADGSSVQNIEHSRIADGNGTLSFPPFSSKEILPEVHDGVYRCIATNRIGSIRSPDIRVNAGTFITSFNSKQFWLLW